MSAELIAIFSFGILFIGALLVLAIRFPHPSDFQYLIFRVVLALAAAGVAALIPGFLDLKVGSFLTAGGALAVFGIIYFYSPANLIGQTGSDRSAAEQALARLHDEWRDVNYIDCEQLIGPDVHQAANALDRTARYWLEKFVEKDVLVRAYAKDYCDLYEQLMSCDRVVPGYESMNKRCPDFVTEAVTNVYEEMKRYAAGT